MSNKFSLAQDLLGCNCRCEFQLVLSDGSRIILVTFMNFDDLCGDRLNKVRAVEGGMRALEFLILKTFSVNVHLK